MSVNAPLDRLTANTLRGLSMDAIQAANSGHPGMPLGMADAATVLFTRFIRYDPTAPHWFDRDRFVLSAGHGSMLLYAMLHLTGTGIGGGSHADEPIGLDDIKQFRQWGSRCAGHPEFGEAPGIETTTGPLGQGFCNGVGMAIAEANLRARFGSEQVDHWTYAIVSDGDLMEGVCAEAASLAGHLGLSRLVYLWDDNGITIDGTTEVAFTEDVLARFAAYGWHVQRVDGHDMEAIATAVIAARASDKPSLIACKTVIGFGSPNKSGKSASHGAPLGVDEVKLTKTALGLDPEQSFVVPAEAVAYVRQRDSARTAERKAWEARVHAAADAGFTRILTNATTGALEIGNIVWPEYAIGLKTSTRKASHAALQVICTAVPEVIGGSADLAESNLTHMKATGAFQRSTPEGRNIGFGIREHAMAAICNGISLHGGLRPFNATFLIFHDYHRPSVRLAGLMHQPVLYVYTHDSIWVGEDGPTHQPTETLQALRLIPNLETFRPCDANEANDVWREALLRTDGPVAMAFSRQDLPVIDRSNGGATVAGSSGVHHGGYVLVEAANAAVTLIASGSEVSLAMEAREVLIAQGIVTRLVNMVSCERFDKQDRAYRLATLGSAPRVSIEAGSTRGWERYVGLEGASVGIDRFGASAPGKIVAEKLGMSVANIVATVKTVLGG